MIYDMNLVTTIDVEGFVTIADSWDEEFSDHYECVEALDDWLEDLTGSVTLFVTPDVVEYRPSIVEGWIDTGHTVGLHIHPGRLQSGESDWLDQYTRAEIEGFVEHGVSVFENELDFSPTTFRAGRWAFSNEILGALGSLEFDIDASHRPPTYTESYRRHGVVEYPMSVYENYLVQWALRPYSISALPMHADGLLSSRLRAAVFYVIAMRLLASNREYLMLSLHDYDISDRDRARRIRRFHNLIANWVTPVGIEALEP